MTGISIYPHVLSELSAPVTIDEFKQGWVVGQPFTLDQPIIPPILNNEESLKTIFKQNGINHLSTQLPSGNKKMYFGTRLITHEVALIELTVPSPTMIGGYQILIKSQSNTVSRSYSHSIALLLS